MRFSTREQYGLRAMVELARRYGGDPVSLSTVAEAEGLSLSYLEQVAASLRDAGLLESRRGAYGGYSLAHAPAEVTAGDVIRALEGTIVRVPCFEERPATPCGREGSCATRNVWLEVRRKLVETLDSITLADLVAGEAGGCCEEPAEGLRCAATVVAGSLSAGGPGTPEWGQSR